VGRWRCHHKRYNIGVQFERGMRGSPMNARWSRKSSKIRSTAAVAHANRFPMKDEKPKRGAPPGHPDQGPARDSSKDSRKDRLKLALRENLKRRKSQARARGDFTNASSGSDDIASHQRREEDPGK
jgi:hypothetical protein